jgi:hypothetical protein
MKIFRLSLVRWWLLRFKLFEIAESLNHCFYPGLRWFWSVHRLNLIYLRRIKINGGSMLDSITCLVDVRIVDLALRLDRVDANLLQAHVSYSVRGLRKRELLVVIQIL